MATHPKDSRPVSGSNVLAGVKVIEFDAIGPAPFCGMMLADHGASVLRIERPGGQPNGFDLGSGDQMLRGRERLPLDLKDAHDIEQALTLIETMDILIEGQRPGVMERLGLGPDICLRRNPRLVYGRITGYGQTGPLSQVAGHDINYIAISGALGAFGEAGRPPMPPLNMLGDFGGGGMLLAFGVMAALHQARRTGAGSVVDAAMIEGVALQMVLAHSLRNAGHWTLQRANNALDGGAPFYRTYETKDGRYVAVGAIERKFFRTLMDVLGLPELSAIDHLDRAEWPRLTQAISDRILMRSRDEWAALCGTSDACLSPVLDMAEAAAHPQNAARAVYGSDLEKPSPRAAPVIMSGRGRPY